MSTSDIIWGVSISVLIIVLIVGVIVILKKNDHDAVYYKRTEKCLDIYDDNYTVINQNKIPNGGRYYNEFFKI